MSILVGKDTRVVIQGLGSAGKFHAQTMLDYGTRIVAAVHPGKAGESWQNVPVFESARQAVEKTGADASCIFVPAAGAADAILEAADAGVRLVVCITEGVPVLDMVRVKQALSRLSTLLVGPNCPGVITPGQCKLGIMPASIHRPGAIGVVSRSGTLTYEAVDQLSREGFGQSTCVGIGGDPVKGLDFVECLRLFASDASTQAVVMIGEIGGRAEQDAAEYIAREFRKPVVAFIAGASAPEGKRMGHAGAIIEGSAGKAESKIQALEEAGVAVCRSPAEIGRTMKKRLGS